MKMRSICLLAAVIGLVAGVARAASVDEAKAQLLEAWGRCKTLTADVSLDAEMSGMAVKGTGAVQVMNEGETCKYLQHIDLALPDPVAMTAVMDALFDGAFLYVTRSVLEEKEVIKTQPGPGVSAPPPGGKPLFDVLEQYFDLKRLDDAEINGRKTIVLEGTPKEGSESRAERMTFQMDVETGITLKLDVAPAGGEKPFSLVYSAIKVNPDIKAEVFTFKAPEGVQVTDLTAPPAPAPAPAPETAPEAAQAEATPAPAGGEAPPAEAAPAPEAAPAQ